MNEISVFEHPEFGAVRHVWLDGVLWFVLSDVAKTLGYQRVADAKAHLRDSQFNGASASIAAELGQQGGKLPTLITEGGLYRLMLRSNAKNAEPFQIWVEDDLLPTVRKAQEVGIDVVESLKSQIEDLKQEVLMSEGEAATMRREVTKEGSVGYRLGYFAGRRSSHYDRAGYDPYKGGQTFKSPPKNREHLEGLQHSR